MFILSGKPDRRNQLSMGLMFQHRHHLQKLILTYNRIRRIGSKAFGDSKQLHTLDMRHNEIISLEVDEFLDLEQLSALFLSHNRLTIIVSGVFWHLKRLLFLDLSYNQLKQLDSSIFLNLRSLVKLDLSGNTLGNISPKTFRFLTNLRELRLANCRLKQLHSLAIEGLPMLTDLDLSFNLLENIHAYEFKAARSLRRLNLDSNKIASMEQNAFSRHIEQHLQLNLTNNLLTQIDTCAFCGSSIDTLDLSRNRLRKLKASDLAPLAQSLQNLNLSFNYDLDETQVAEALSTLKSLSICNISNMALDDRFRFRNAFSGSARALTTIDLSFNYLHNLSGNSFPSLTQLQYLDLSKNLIEALDSNATSELARLSSISVSFQRLRLAANGLSCHTCDLFYFWSWLRTKPNPLMKNCENGDARDCLLCRTPNYMRNQRVDLLTDQMLATCDPIGLSTRSPNAGSRIAMVVGLFSISLIVILLVLVLIRKRYKGGIYYTNESRKNKSDANTNNQTGGDAVPISTICSNHSSRHSSIEMIPEPSRPFNVDCPTSLQADLGADLGVDQVGRSRRSSHISKEIIDDILHQVEADWRYVDEPPYNDFSAARLKEVEEQRIHDELQMPSDSLTMPSSMTVLETYVRCGDIDATNEGPFSSYELPDDFEQTSAKTYEISPYPFLV